MHRFRAHGKRLTANTRSNEVFPAFCNPMTVTSISVALYSALAVRQQTASLLDGRMGFVAMEFGGQSVPEQAKEPIVYTAKYSRHGESR